MPPEHPAGRNGEASRAGSLLPQHVTLEDDCIMTNHRGWLFDTLVGGLVGGIVGAIVAVNTIIWFGIDYDATLVEVFGESFVAGVITVTLWVGGPIVGVVAMRRRRHARDAVRPSSARPHRSS